MRTQMQNGSRARVFVPATDVYETKEGMALEIEMPGVEEGSIDLTVEKNVLKVSARLEGPELEGHRLGHCEYLSEGMYERTFALSEDLDTNRVQATYKHGVLYLELPRSEAAKPKKITVQAS